MHGCLFMRCNHSNHTNLYSCGWIINCRLLQMKDNVHDDAFYNSVSRISRSHPFFNMTRSCLLIPSSSNPASLARAHISSSFLTLSAHSLSLLLIACTAVRSCGECDMAARVTDV